MIKQLVIHLGDRRTGSTAVQDALVANQINCPTAQICYPTGSNHNPLAKTLSLKPRPANPLPGQREMRFSHIAKRIAQSDADIAVISAEQFDGVDPALLKATLAQYFPDLVKTIRLIAYVRPHADRLVSNYAEAVKLGQFEGDLQAYYTHHLAKTPLHYTDRFTRWRTVFGDAFTLRPFGRKTLVGGDIVQDFAQFLFGDTPHSVQNSPPPNTALSLQDLAMVGQLQSRIGAKPNMSKFQVNMGKTLGQLLAASRDPAQTQTKLSLHADLAKTVQTTYLADARALDAAFFAPQIPMQDALQTACDTAVAAPQSIAAKDHLSPAAIRLVSVWAGLLCSQPAANGAILRDILKTGPEAAENTKKSGSAKKGPGQQRAGQKGSGPKGKKGKKGGKPQKDFTEDDLIDLF